MDFIPVFYFYFIWFLAGFGVALLLRQLNRFRPVNPVVLLTVTVIVGLLLVILGVRVV